MVFIQTTQFYMRLKKLQYLQCIEEFSKLKRFWVDKCKTITFIYTAKRNVFINKSYNTK